VDFDRQLRYFQLQHDRMPEGRFWIPLADLMLRHGRIPEARALLEQGLRGWPASVSGRWLLARCLEADGELAAAQEAVATVLAHDPGHGGARTLQEILARRRAEEPELAVALEAPAPADPGVEDAMEAPLPTDDPRDLRPRIMARPRLSVVPAPEVSATEDDEPDVTEAAAAAAVEPAAAAPASAASTAAASKSGETPRAQVAAAGFRLADDPAPTFVTRTLADIYLEQGHREKALQILRQVLTVHPERDDITTRIRAIENGAEVAADAPLADPDHDLDNRRRFDAWLRREAGAGE